jgi:hypothetical protein
MPAEQRVGLDDDEGVPPGADSAGEQHQERAVGRRHGRALHAAAQHDHLVAEEGVLGGQLGPTPQEVRADPCGVRRHGPSPEVAPEGVPYAGDGPRQPLAVPSQ